MTNGEVSGDYHEYAFASKFDKPGRLWVCSADRILSSRFRGAGGLSADNSRRESSSPHSGIARRGSGERGGACSTRTIQPLERHLLATAAWLRKVRRTSTEGSSGTTKQQRDGRPQRNRKAAAAGWGEAREDPSTSLRDSINKRSWGQWPRGWPATRTAKFGPFVGQMFVGDQRSATIAVRPGNGGMAYQGACFRSAKDIASGTLGLEMTRRGAMSSAGHQPRRGSRGQ